MANRDHDPEVGLGLRAVDLRNSHDRLIWAVDPSYRNHGKWNDLGESASEWGTVRGIIELAD